MVSRTTEAQRLAGKVCERLRAGFAPTLRAIGAGAVNQAVKACAIASDMLKDECRLLVEPGFTTVSMPSFDGPGAVNRSAVVLRVQRCDL